MRKYLIKTQIEIGDGEAFWGGAVAHGIHMPLTRDSDWSFDSCGQGTTNPVSGIFCSTQGRYILLKDDFRITVRNGVMTLEADEAPVMERAGNCLREAYLAAAATFARDPVPVPRELMTHPQYCTWTEMLVDITEDKILDYARSVVESGMPYGALILDDGWMKAYGEWEFAEGKFSDPKRMIERLHQMGFKVQLWLVPFVDKDACDYDLLVKNNALVRGADGKIAEREWWNGTSAVLDMTNSFAWSWLKERLDSLVERYEVDGFKFDAGDCIYYRDDDVTAKKTTASGQNLLWAEFAGQYRYSELRACFNYAGQHTIIRLCDKRSSWDRVEGIGALVPNMINAGLCGYPYACADMIGGGSIADFEGDGQGADYELISRFCECAALMPCMQFSHAYWRRNDIIKAMFLKYARIHSELRDHLTELIGEAEKTHAPILRALEYEFPHQGFEKTVDDFMLGSDYLVSPVIFKGQTEKTLTLPSGFDWSYAPTGQRYRGGEKVTVPAPVGTLPYFKKV